MAHRRRAVADEAEQEAFEAARTAAIDAAVVAELAWLNGGDEPVWPTWPDEQPHLRRGTTIRVPGPVTPEEFEADDDLEQAIAAPGSNIHVDSRAAAAWLQMLQGAPVTATPWRQDVVEVYADWSARMNGMGFGIDAEIDREPTEWNHQYYSLFAERLLDGPDTQFPADVKRVTALPDAPFGNVAETVQHAADALYFNNPDRPSDRPVALRRALVARVMALRRWQSSDDPAAARIDLESGGIIAKMLLNTHDTINGTHSYLPRLLFDRVDPLLPAIHPMLPGGPTVFVARCTMNLLLVAPRARHLEFLLDAVEAWFGRTMSPTLWIASGVGRQVVEWFEAAMLEEPGMLTPGHWARGRIDRVLGQLVGVGVAEAHDLERRVAAEAAAVLIAPLYRTPD